MAFTLLQSKFVKHNPGAGGSGTSLTFAVVFTTNVTVGSAIVVTAITKSGIPVSTVTDTLGNTYTRVFPPGQNGSDSNSEIWIANNSPAGANTVTVTYGSSSYGYACAAEYATGSQYLIPDQGAWANGLSGSTPLSLDTGAPPTSIVASELLICFGGTLSVDSITYSAGSGFTIEQQDAVAGPGISFFFEDKTVSSTGAFHGLATATGANVASGNFVIIVQPFYLAAAAPATIPVQSASQAKTTNVTTNALAFPSNNTSGNVIVVVAIAFNSAPPNLSVADSQLNSYSVLRGPDRSAADNSVTQVWIARNIHAGANTVTLTLTVAQTSILMIFEYSFVGNLDKSVWRDSASAGGNSQTLDSGASGATASANEFLFTYGGTEDVPGTLAARQGFFQEKMVDDETGLQAMAVSDQNVTSVGSYHGTAWLGGPGSTTWQQGLLTFSNPSTVNKVHNIDAYVDERRSVHSIDASVIIVATTVNKAHSIDARISVDNLPSVPFVAASYSASGVLDSGPLNIPVSGIQVGDVILGWIRWNESSNQFLPTVGDSSSFDQYFQFITGTIAGDPAVLNHILRLDGYITVVQPGAPSSFNVFAAQTPGLIDPVDLMVVVVRNANTQGLIAPFNPNLPLQSLILGPTLIQSTAVGTGTSTQAQSGSKITNKANTLALGCGAVLFAPPMTAGPGWVALQTALKTVTTDPLLPNAGTSINALFQQPIGGAQSWIAEMLLLNPTAPGVHFIDAYIQTPSFVKLAGNIIAPIRIPNYVRLNGTLATPGLSAVKLAGTIQGPARSFVNLAGNIQSSTRSYVRLAVTIQRPTFDLHNIDTDVSVPNLSYVQMVGTIRGAIQQGPCGSFPDASYVNLRGWIVAPGDSVQMPNSGFTSADDFLSSQEALATYKPMSVFILNGVALIINAFTTGVVSWQTRTRPWLRRVDAAPNGILLTTKVNTHTLPNGAVITTTTNVTQNQDKLTTTITIQNSATPLRTSQIITEKSKTGHTTTIEKETNNANGVFETTTKTVFSRPPTTENIQPLKVTTLDGVQHYQFFGVVNNEWAGGDQEGTTVSSSKESIVGNTKTTNEVVDTPDGKHIETTTTIVGSPEAGTTTTQTSSEFSGTQTTVHKVITYPNGATTTVDTVTNDLTGDSVETAVETVTDEFGQVTITTTKTETTTFVDPTTGLTRTVENKTITVNKGGVTTTDNTVDTTTDFEDDIYTQKVQVIFIQEFTINCVIDEMNMFGLWEVNETHQKNYALLELFGQQLGNLNLSYLLRQSLIDQFNTANACVKPVTLQANGRTYQVVFAPSASSFRAKYIPGTEPHVYELQIILQERSNLINGTSGFF